LTTDPLSTTPGAGRLARQPRRTILSLLLSVVVIAMLMVGAVYLRYAFGGASEVRAAGGSVPVSQPVVILGPQAAQSAAPIESVPPKLIDAVTGKPIWWSTGTLQLPQDALTSSGQSNDTKCPSGEECPDPLAP